MKYKIIVNNQLYKIRSADSIDYQLNTTYTKKPKDTTQIEFNLYNNNQTLDYTIFNASEKIQYLLSQNELYLGIFVKENLRWMPRKWRKKEQTTNRWVENHLTRRCVYVVRISSLQGTISIPYWKGRPISRSLYYIFTCSNYIQNPKLFSGEDYISVGLGRGQCISAFRPHVVSEEQAISIVNKL